MKQKFGKVVTIVEGIDEKQLDLKDLMKQLKSKLACGGSIKGGVIKLQGKHNTRVRNALVEMGFSPETIDMR